MGDKLVKFGECAKLIRDSVDPENVNPDTPYIGLQHIAPDELRLIETGNASDVVSNKYQFKKGDILFGKLRPYFRKVIIAPFNGVCSTDIWVVRATDKCDQNFLFYWMASQEFVDKANQGSEGTKMPRAKWNFVSKIENVLPNLEQQRRIGSFLKSFDDKIELNQRMNETLEAIARAIFKSWFVDFDPVRAKITGEPYPLPGEIMALFPDELVESELGLIPKGWEVTTIGDVYEFSYGKSLPKRKRILGQYPVYGSNGIIGTHDEKLVNGPGIVIGRKGNPGFITWAATDFFPIDTTFYLETNLPKLFAFYQLNYLNLPRLSADSAVPGLNRNIAYLEKIYLPKLEVLNSFTKITSPLYDKVHFNNKEIEILANIRDNLLSKLLKGEFLGVEIDEQLEWRE